MKYLLQLLFFTNSLPVWSQPFTPDLKTTRAVVIGISDYQDDDIEDLKNPAYAALAFGAYLKSKAGGELADENLRLLINENASAGQMNATLTWLMDSGKPGDRAIFYFSGYAGSQSFVTYDMPYLSINSNAFPIKRTNETLKRMANNTMIELVIIEDVYPPFLKNENDILEKSSFFEKHTPIDSHEVLLNPFVGKNVLTYVSDFKDAKDMTSHFLDAIIGRADYNDDMVVSLQETEIYLHSEVRPDLENHGLLYIYANTPNKPFSTIDESILKQLQKDEKNILPPIVQIDSENFENSLLKKEPESVRNLYQDFVVAIRLGNLLSPKGFSANDLYEQLLGETESKSLRNASKRKLIAALQDESQQAINAYLRTDHKELLVRRSFSGKYYLVYAQYLGLAATLLGEKHYLYKYLRAKQYYFEGIVIRLDAQKLYKEDDAYQNALQKQQLALQYEDQAAFIYNEIGLIYGEMKNYDQSIINFLKAIELSPQWSIPYSNLCDSYRKITELDQAIHYGQKAIEIDPDYSMAHNNLGDVYLEKKLYKKAENYYKKAIKIFPESPNGYFNMARSKAKRGKTSLANKWLEEAFIRDFNDYESIFENSDLQNIFASSKYKKLIKKYEIDKKAAVHYLKY